MTPEFDPRQCPNCKRRMKNAYGVYLHINARHGGKGREPYKEIGFAEQRTIGTHNGAQHGAD